MDNRRKEERKKLMAFTLVRDARQGAILGYLGDLTLQGAMIIGEHVLETGMELTLSIDLPGELEGIVARKMTIPARVARCIPDETPGSIKVGVEFTEITPENKRLIQALLERYHFRDPLEAK